MTQSGQSGQSVLAELQPAGAEPPAEVFDCWNTIGISGNGSCRELLRFIHCRNCPVYSEAAAMLLDRPVIPRWRDEWTEHFAKEKKFTTPARTSVVIFRLGQEWLALPTPAFQEVAERRGIHSLPRKRPGMNLVLGLVNIRGELLICVSLARLLGLEARKPAGVHRPASALDLRLSERWLVTIWEGQRLVFPVDEVHGVRRVHQDEIQPPPAGVALSGRSSVRGLFPWRDHTVGLLNADLLFANLNRNLS